MIIILSGQATDAQIQQIEETLKEHGLGAHVSRGVEKIIIGAIGATDDHRAHLVGNLQTLDFVERVVPILTSYKRVAREANPEGTTVCVGAVKCGPNQPQVVVIAGPCSVESQAQILEVAHAVKAAGASILRGGAFKPRTLPYDFQGLGEKGLEYLAEARRQTGLPIVTEVMDPRDVALVSQYADILQLGTRNMQNFPLLREVGQTGQPVLFKRGLYATIDEWLKAAEYILAEGNEKVLLCERGIRGFDPAHTRNVLDLTAIPVLRRLTHLPVLVDPSHGTGRWEYVPPMARAAVAAGADGLMIEVHPEPVKALSDGGQSLTPDQFAQLMRELALVAQAVGRGI